RARGAAWPIDGSRGAVDPERSRGGRSRPAGAEPGRGDPPALCAARRRRSLAAAGSVCRRTALVRSVIVVDTNVISELVRGEPHPAVLAWGRRNPVRYSTRRTSIR